METNEPLKGSWICRDSLQLKTALSDRALIEQYVSCRAFHTSFLQSNKDETGIHGPFVASRIKPDDFLPMEDWDIEHYLSSLRFWNLNSEKAKVERAKLSCLLKSVFTNGRRCYVLRYDERSEDLWHDWGFVLDIFREFLFVDLQQGCLDRLIIGND